jgi:MFS family permease
MADKTSDAGNARLGPILLAPGVSRLNMWTLLYAAFFTIGLVTFTGVATPYVLTAILKIPQDQQGAISGDLVFWNELVAIFCFGPVGVLADRIGRKPIFVAGFAIMATAMILYPLAASITQLTLYRIWLAVGMVTVTGVLATVVSDYPQETTRGKLVALTGFMNGLGAAAVTAIFGGLPKRFTDAGLDEVTAGEYTLWIAAALCALSALVVGLGLKGGTPGVRAERPEVGEIVRGALRAAREPRVALAYSAAFVARGDLVILGIFLILWGKNAGVSDGLSLADATSRATFVFVLTQVAALAWTVGVLFVLDRFNRVTGMAGCMLLSAIGYLGTLFIDNPLATSDLPLVIMLGIGTISAFLGSQTLIGQEAPERERGAVVSGFNLSGAVGILLCSLIGGRLFDSVSPTAPFVMAGALSLVVFALCIVVRVKAPGRMPLPRKPHDHEPASA